MSASMAGDLKDESIVTQNTFTPEETMSQSVLEDLGIYDDDDVQVFHYY